MPPKCRGFRYVRMECKHPEKPDVCDETCACWCDACQERYEETWKKIVGEKFLCDACGMPLEMAPYSLRLYEYMHFYMPCDSCKPAYEALMKKEGLCTICRCAASEGHKCPGGSAAQASSADASMPANTPAS